ncbi:hypothetical protein CVT25_004370 [Psilocybe cyanescens]|uniref:Uncharacterized protein n=1 Tax=Psilocybe cyanescens TaxID=93625 RepID=A0A409XVW9_PSICY|nr:hypothetical protein CVT25_004370 [Psilocybe cyanescens]
MNVGTAGFESCIRAPSPAPGLPPMPSFGMPTHISVAHPAQVLPTSNIESFESSTVYSRPYSIDSAGSRTSWSSAEVDWARQGAAIEESHRAQRENAELSKQVSTWRAKFETLQYVLGSYGGFALAEFFTRMAYNLLLARVPAPPEAERKKLNHEDYKQIDYRYKHQWVSSSGDRITDIAGRVENENEDEDVEADAEGEELRSTSPAPGAQRGQGRSRAGINVSMRYIQDKDGQIIDGHRAREVRIHARAVFVGFAMQGKQFLSWGDADAISRRTFYNEMAIRFDELQYCDLDWKAEQIATDTFPGWKVTWLKKQKKVLEQQNTEKGLKRARQGSAVEKPDPKRSKAMEVASTSSAPSPEAPATSQVAQQSVPVINIIPNTPIRPPPATVTASVNMQGLEQYHSHDHSLLQANKPHYNFSSSSNLSTMHNTNLDLQINNPLTNGINGLTLTTAPLPGQFMPVLPANGIGSQAQQALEANSTQPIPGNVHNPPAKRSRTGTTKMRPSKTTYSDNIPVRNLCALEWVILNPKGTTDEFGTYYDGLSAEGTEKWEQLSVDAKEPGKNC